MATTRRPRSPRPATQAAFGGGADPRLGSSSAGMRYRTRTTRAAKVRQDPRRAARSRPRPAGRWSARRRSPQPVTQHRPWPIPSRVHEQRISVRRCPPRAVATFPTRPVATTAALTSGSAPTTICTLGRVKWAEPSAGRRTNMPPRQPRGPLRSRRRGRLVAQPRPARLIMRMVMPIRTLKADGNGHRQERDPHVGRHVDCCPCGKMD